MIAEMGAFALVLSLVLSVAQVGLSALGGGLQVRAFAGAGQGASWNQTAWSRLAAYAEPSQFAGLPHSEVTHLQAVLLDQRGMVRVSVTPLQIDLTHFQQIDRVQAWLSA